MSEYIAFVGLPIDNQKTKTFVVLNKHHNETLGFVKWFGAWREYCFFPSSGIVLSAGCQRHIAEFIDKQMKEWRESHAKKGKDKE